MGNSKEGTSKAKRFVLLSLLSLVLGFVAGAVVWALLKIINSLTEVIWTIIPELLGVDMLAYNIGVCSIGALIIALLARKFGNLPHLTEEVMLIMKKKGGYPYNQLGRCALCAIVPLIFGGVLGPEAGLVGIIAGLCYWIGDNLKYRGITLETLSETGAGIALSIVFATPLVGIVNNLEPDYKSEKYLEKLKEKKGRIVLYVLGIIGGFGAFALLGYVVKLIVPGSEEGGLPRFTRDYTFEWELLLWAIPLIAVGILAGAIYSMVNRGFGKLGKRFGENRVIPALIAAVVIGILGYFFPEVMFSGEHQLGPIIENWQGYVGEYLIIVGVLKFVASCLCLNFGWRGGAIFPIIFGGATIGYGFAILFGLPGGFTAAVVIASSYAYIQRKPVTVAAILLLCFPITYIPLILIIAFIASKVPNPFVLSEEEEEKELEESLGLTEGKGHESKVEG